MFDFLITDFGFLANPSAVWDIDYIWTSKYLFSPWNIWDAGDISKSPFICEKWQKIIYV